MQLLAPLASLLGLELEELVARLKKDAVLWTLVAVFAAIGVVFMLVALNAWLTLLWGPVLAPLAIAGGALLIALGLYVGMRIIDGIAARREHERRHAAERSALVATAAITAVPILLKSDLLKKVGIPVGGALAAAYLLTKPGANGHRHHPDDAE